LDHQTRKYGPALGAALVALAFGLACPGAGEQPISTPQGPTGDLGGVDTAQTGATTTGTLEPTGPATDEPASTGPAALAQPNRPPEFFLPPHRAVGRGQKVSFGLAAIDPEMDTVRVDLIEKPASASYDPYTLTVTWTPTARDAPAGHFTAKVTETQRDGGKVRTYLHPFSIPVTRGRQPEPRARALAPVVETLITVHDPARLTEVNKKFPFDLMLERGALMLQKDLPADQQAKLGTPDRRALYQSFLKELAWLHDNPRLDPDSKEFDRASFGDPKSWKVITVRPRLDKKWQEVRVVYQAANAPEPVFAMFRFRPTTDPAPPEAREVNNKVFSQSVYDAFFDQDGRLEAKLADDPSAHARALATWLEGVLSYKDPEQGWARASFLALPTEARMGGGSTRGPDGAYASGDGWAWSVLKPLPAGDGSSQAYQSMPIPGFWTAMQPAGDTWKPVCAPRFDPHDAGHAPGYGVLCRAELGLVDLPELDDGKVAKSKRDAHNLFVEHKLEHSVAGLPLRDPRRDLGEENGMTCSQCHTRDFGVRDYYLDLDPKNGAPGVANPAIPTTNFIIVPTTGWEPYTIQFQQDQECKARKAMKELLGKETSLTCPLAP
jgi:hypothetical protein